MVISEVQQSVSVTNGTGSVQTGQPIMGLCRQFIVNPPGGAGTYHIELLNHNSEVIYKREGESGTLAELLTLPVVGHYTFKISNASSDGTYTFRLLVETNA